MLYVVYDWTEYGDKIVRFASWDKEEAEGVAKVLGSNIDEMTFVDDRVKRLDQTEAELKKVKTESEHKDTVIRSYYSKIIEVKEHLNRTSQHLKRIQDYFNSLHEGDRFDPNYILELVNGK